MREEQFVFVLAFPDSIAEKCLSEERENGQEIQDSAAKNLFRFSPPM
jgi:hypothetical protein